MNKAASLRPDGQNGGRTPSIPERLREPSAQAAEAAAMAPRGRAPGKKIVLSYTTINNYLRCHHSYLNKIMGIKTPESENMRLGKEAHRIIQNHCLGIAADPRLEAFEWKFMEAEHHTLRSYNEKYTLHGYIDMIAYNSKVMAEIKTGAIWSQQRFYDLMQWRYYALVTGFRRVLLINCRFDLSNFKTYYFEVTDEDLRKAQIWVDEAIAGIDAGRFTDDLVDGVCTDPRCPYGTLCHWAPK